MEKIDALLNKNGVKATDLKPELLELYNDLNDKTNLYNEKVDLEEAMADDDPDLPALQAEIDELDAATTKAENKLCQKVTGWINGMNNKKNGRLFTKKTDDQGSNQAPEPVPAPVIPVQQTSPMPAGPIVDTPAEPVATPAPSPTEPTPAPSPTEPTPAPAQAVPIVEQPKEKKSDAGVWIFAGIALVCSLGLVNLFSKQR